MVYAENFDRVYGFVAYRVRSTEQAEDLTQLAFEKAYRAWNRFDPQRGSAATWLLSITRNVLIDHFRKRRESLLGDEAVAQVIDEHARVGRSSVTPELAMALEGLTPREQTVIALRFGADLSGRDIAELTGLSVDNVHQVASRALRKLRSALEPSDPWGD